MNEPSPKASADLQRVSVTEARRSWNRLINQVVTTKTPVIITRYGKPVAILGPYIEERDHE